MRKIFCVLLATLLFAAISPMAIGADSEILSFGRVYVAMPEIKVEVKGQSDSTEEISAYLGSEALELEDVHPYNNRQDSTCVYILVDVSESMKDSAIVFAKNNIKSYVETMGPDDQMVLITFGEQEVETLLQGGESKEEILSVVDEMNYTSGVSPLYEGLQKVYQLANASLSQFDRAYIIAFSDGNDTQDGTITFNEVTEPFKSHSLPLYAACAPRATKTGMNRFGELARSSGGALVRIEQESDFEQLLQEINNVTMLSFRAPTNAADGSTRQLALQIGDSRAELNIPVSRSIPDQEPPRVEELDFDSETGEIQIHFSERVVGALSPASYKIQDSDGKLLDVAFVANATEENTVLLTVRGLKNGTYTVSVLEVTDASLQKNPLVFTGSLTISSFPEPSSSPEHGSGKEKAAFPLWAILTITGAILALAGVVTVILVRASRKKAVSAETAVPSVEFQNSHESAGAEIYEYGQNERRVQHHIMGTLPRKVYLRVKTGRTAEQKIETDITSSLIIGRSDVCDVFIDDTKLSRQHFAIENDNGRLFITDLQSRNGTFVNGTRVSSRQVLQSGDHISAGLSDIIINY